MDALMTVAMLASVAGIVTLAVAAGLVRDAREEFQGRLRDLALSRARRLLLSAGTACASAAVIAGYAGWPHTDALGDAHAGELLIGGDLKLSTTLGDASGLGPHLREQEHVADRR